MGTLESIFLNSLRFLPSISQMIIDQIAVKVTENNNRAYRPTVSKSSHGL